MWGKKYTRHKAEGKETSRLPREDTSSFLKTPTRNELSLVYFFYLFLFSFKIRSFSMGGRGVETAITNERRQLCSSSGA